MLVNDTKCYRRLEIDSAVKTCKVALIIIMNGVYLAPLNKTLCHLRVVFVLLLLYLYPNPLNAGTVFRRRNLTSVESDSDV